MKKESSRVVVDINQCTGCGVCAEKCPKKALSIERNDEGFYYPVFDERICVDCGLCADYCHYYCDTINENGLWEKRAYRVISMDNDIRFNSTSGGLFSELSSVVLRENGVIYGAAYEYEKKRVSHRRIDCIEELYALRQSKYVESSLLNVYRELLKDIDNRKNILFCGAPCQVAAVKKFIGIVPENLVLVDFACMGAASPKAFYYWVDEYETKLNSKLTKCWFKYKDEGWRKSPLTTKLEFDNGEMRIFRGSDNYYMRGYVEDLLFMRPCCSNCKYKGTSKQSDITIGDYWGIQGETDDDIGVSFCIINTDKGHRMFKRIEERLVSKEISIEQACSNNRGMTDKIERNSEANSFLGDLGGEKVFSILYEEYCCQAEGEKSECNG